MWEVKGSRGSRQSCFRHEEGGCKNIIPGNYANVPTARNTKNDDLVNMTKKLGVVNNDPENATLISVIKSS